MTRRSVGISSLVIVGFLLAGCEDSVAPPPENLTLHPAWLDLRLSAPDQGAQAVLFQLTGGPIDSVVSRDHTLYTNEVVRNDWQGLLVGKMADGVVARIWVPDPSTVGQYRAVIRQAVARDGFDRQQASDYALRIEPPRGP